MNRNFSHIYRITGSAITLALVSANLLAQSPQERQFTEQAAGGGWFSVVVIGLVAIGVAFFAWRKFGPKVLVYDDRSTNYYNSNESYEMDGFDVDKEIERLRKAKKRKSPPQAATPLPRRPSSGSNRATGAIDLDTKAFQEKMRKMQYSQLPINSFLDLRPARMCEPLPVSDDPSLLDAIDQANEEYEEDESVREVALKVLAAFATRNSVESLTQLALYDLSSNLRSKAVSALTDFDHASVFEPILLACADPTREVRAAAARGLFRLSFDRADAWKRLVDSNDEFRMRHAARAAVESGIAMKSFDRLVHEDLKVAYEAFALVALLVKSGETDEIFDAIKTHKDERVRFALVQCLKILRDERAVKELAKLKRTGDFSLDVSERIADVIKHCEAVSV